MPKKIFLAILLSLLAIPVLLQIARVSAEEAPITSPLTPPITSPVTPTPTMTVTPTITMTPTPTTTGTPTPTTSVTPSVSPTITPTPSPVPSVTVSGHVTSRQLGRLFGNTQRVSSLSGITVKLRPFFGGSSVETMTDNNGMYSFIVQPGMYEVSVSHADAFFVPSFRFVRVGRNGDMHIDFQSLLFPHFPF